MTRAFLSVDEMTLATLSDDEILGRLAAHLRFALEPAQRAAWTYQIEHLRTILARLPDARAYMEFLIPRMGRRADLVLLRQGILFIIEYKVGAKNYDRESFNQVYGYGLDLKHFHETSHDLLIIPILVATQAPYNEKKGVNFDDDGLAKPIGVNADGLVSVILDICRDYRAPSLDAGIWEAGRYQPTPTIIEAAQALYSGHNVAEISRSEAGSTNITVTANYVADVIDTAKRERRKMICFITGVPGSGKTLAGLNLATARQRAHADEHALFLSGNGPLVNVLREALVADAVQATARRGIKTDKQQEIRRVGAFIQNIHHFRDEALKSLAAPVERVVVFDEAQRAWNVEQTSKFMRGECGQSDFSMSEAEFLLSIMNRHDGWCVVICLVGSGQEINTGEAGIDEWLQAIERGFQKWQVHLPPGLTHSIDLKNQVFAPALHLSTSIRSFRAESLSDFIGCVISGDSEAARQIKTAISDYPLFVTRDLERARQWLRARRRGHERSGLLSSSNALRLRPSGICVEAKIKPTHWFLAPHGDVRASDALENVGTEFDVQGLELDWSCVCWDANYRRVDDVWKSYYFKGTRWQKVNNEMRQRFVANSYRVLLTRARQGMIVFVPLGSYEDATRLPEFYDQIYDFLSECGFDPLLP